MSRLPASFGGSTTVAGERPTPGMSRWLILAGYGVLAASTQLLWLTFAPITTQTARKRGIRVDVIASEYTVPGLIRALAASYG